jgi:hypothetical protein
LTDTAGYCVKSNSGAASKDEAGVSGEQDESLGESIESMEMGEYGGADKVSEGFIVSAES